MSDTQTIVNKAAYNCSLIFSQRPYGTDVQWEDIEAAQKQFAMHIQAACEDATRDLLAACELALDVWDNRNEGRQLSEEGASDVRAAIAKAKPNGGE